MDDFFRGLTLNGYIWTQDFQVVRRVRVLINAILVLNVILQHRLEASEASIPATHRMVLVSGQQGRKAEYLEHLNRAMISVGSRMHSTDPNNKESPLRPKAKIMLYLL